MTDQNSQVFGEMYARAYDLCYRTTNYDAEVDWVVQLYKTHGVDRARPLPPLHHVFDMGYGTGSHAVSFMKKGWVVSGVERSAPMAAIARERVKSWRKTPSPLPPELLVGDFQDVVDGRVVLDGYGECDLAAMIFIVIGYQFTNEDLMTALTAARNSLRLGGVLYVDYWYGPTVVTSPPRAELHEYKVDETASWEKLYRLVSPRVDYDRNLVNLTYKLVGIKRDGGVEETIEHHGARYFFEPELRLAGSCAGLRLITTHPFMDSSRRATVGDWKVASVFSAV